MTYNIGIFSYFKDFIEVIREPWYWGSILKFWGHPVFWMSFGVNKGKIHIFSNFDQFWSGAGQKGENSGISPDKHENAQRIPNF